MESGASSLPRMRTLSFLAINFLPFILLLSHQ
jgi:hypothetical protein